MHFKRLLTWKDQWDPGSNILINCYLTPFNTPLTQMLMLHTVCIHLPWAKVVKSKTTSSICLILTVQLFLKQYSWRQTGFCFFDGADFHFRLVEVGSFPIKYMIADTPLNITRGSLIFLVTSLYSHKIASTLLVPSEPQLLLTLFFTYSIGGVL